MIHMNDLLEIYADIITQHSHLLMRDDNWKLNPKQAKAIVAICHCADNLHRSMGNITTLPAEEMLPEIEVGLRDLTTPIKGYAQILCKEIIGSLTPTQMMHAQIVLAGIQAFCDDVQTMRCGLRVVEPAMAAH